MLTRVCYDVLFDITYYLARIKTDKIKIKKKEYYHYNIIICLTEFQFTKHLTHIYKHENHC